MIVLLKHFLATKISIYAVILYNNIYTKIYIYIFTFAARINDVTGYESFGVIFVGVASDEINIDSFRLVISWSIVIT